jgi:hypothetical protein
MDNIDLSVASTYGGFLYKKSPSFFAGYQKRYFQILDGKLLTYAEKQGGQAKGAVRLELISDISLTADDKK